MIDSYLKNVDHTMLPNEIDMDDLESEDELNDTPRVSLFLDSDDESADVEVLNELDKYGNMGNFYSMIGFRKFVAYFDPLFPMNIITRKAYNTIMVEGLESTGRNLVSIVRDVYIPFRAITQLEYDSVKGLISFSRIFDTYIFRMPRTIPRLKNFEWSKVPPILVLSQRDLMSGLRLYLMRRNFGVLKSFIWKEFGVLRSGALIHKNREGSKQEGRRIRTTIGDFGGNCASNQSSFNNGRIEWEEEKEDRVPTTKIFRSKILINNSLFQWEGRRIAMVPSKVTPQLPKPKVKVEEKIVKAEVVDEHVCEVMEYSNWTSCGVIGERVRVMSIVHFLELDVVEKPLEEEMLVGSSNHLVKVDVDEVGDFGYVINEE
ncbi:hypothetical protein Tco_0738658 [Tanacetum coccineum]